MSLIRLQDLSETIFNSKTQQQQQTLSKYFEDDEENSYWSNYSRRIFKSDRI